MGWRVWGGKRCVARPPYIPSPKLHTYTYKTGQRGTDHVDEVLVVRDDDELEVLLLAPLRDQPRDGPRQPALMYWFGSVWFSGVGGWMRLGVFCGVGGVDCVPACPREGRTLLSWSRLVVGSSSVMTPQLMQKVSASASRITMEASTLVSCCVR